MKAILKYGLAAAALFGMSAAASAADQRFISIGTGGVTGVYYPTGGAICRLVNKNAQGTRHPLLGRIDRWLGLQHQHRSRRRAGVWCCPV
jgi:hypothetical protein